MKEIKVTQEMVDERKSDLAELKSEIDEEVKEYNALGSEKEPSAAEVAKAMNEIDEDVKEYNSTSMKEIFEECLLDGGESALYKAAVKLYYPIIKAKEQKLDDSDDTVLVVVEDTRVINPLVFKRFAKAEFNTKIGKDDFWERGANKLGYLFAIKVAQDISPEKVEAVKKRYDIPNQGADIDLGIKSVSNRNITSAFDKILDSMLGDGERKYQHTVSHDVNFFRELYTSQGKGALNVRCANKRKLLENMLKVAHHVVVGTEYGLEYKEKKDAIEGAKKTESDNKEEPEKQEKDQPKKNRRKSQPKAEDAAA